MFLENNYRRKLFLKNKLKFLLETKVYKYIVIIYLQNN